MGHVKFSLSCLLHSNRDQEGRYAETLSQCLWSQHQRQQYPDKFWKAATGTKFDFFFKYENQEAQRQHSCGGVANFSSDFPVMLVS